MNVNVMLADNNITLNVLVPNVSMYGYTGGVRGILHKVPICGALYTGISVPTEYKYTVHRGWVAHSLTNFSPI